MVMYTNVYSELNGYMARTILEMCVNSIFMNDIIYLRNVLLKQKWYTMNTPLL